MNSLRETHLGRMQGTQEERPPAGCTGCTVAARRGPAGPRNCHHRSCRSQAAEGMPVDHRVVGAVGMAASRQLLVPAEHINTTFLQACTETNIDNRQIPVILHPAEFQTCYVTVQCVMRSALKQVDDYLGHCISAPTPDKEEYEETKQNCQDDNSDAYGNPCALQWQISFSQCAS